jgi:MFS family permease
MSLDRAITRSTKSIAPEKAAEQDGYFRAKRRLLIGLVAAVFTIAFVLMAMSFSYGVLTSIPAQILMVAAFGGGLLGSIDVLKTYNKSRSLTHDFQPSERLRTGFVVAVGILLLASAALAAASLFAPHVAILLNAIANIIFVGAIVFGIGSFFLLPDTKAIPILEVDRQLASAVDKSSCGDAFQPIPTPTIPTPKSSPVFNSPPLSSSGVASSSAPSQIAKGASSGGQSASSINQSSQSTDFRSTPSRSGASTSKESQQLAGGTLSNKSSPFFSVSYRPHGDEEGYSGVKPGAKR